MPIAEFEGGLARADLADLVEAARDEAEAMLALPSFDELHVGYKDRSCLTDEAGEALICPAKNGMFRPMAVAGGRLVAVRAPGSQAGERTGLWVPMRNRRDGRSALGVMVVVRHST